jgi:plasmid stabilization system protein ParE
MILKRRKAVSSIIEQANWISDESPDSAFRFLEAVDETFALLLQNPEMGRQYQSISRRLAEVRVWRVSGFEKILIFYRPHAKGIEILDLIHSSRDLSPILKDLV